jgi:uncharacterized protein YbbC (DUF1343 family)/CubicO group peptidase (beta-lactamase class C family)
MVRMGRLEQVVATVDQAIAGQEVPGAVVLVGRRDDLLLAHAAGFRRLMPTPQPMRLHTIFDLASLTKPLVTATLAMQLVEEGRLCLDEPLCAYLSPFASAGKELILVRDLLTHSSGLPAWKNYLADPPTQASDRRQRLEAVVEDLARLPLQAPPGEKFIYSDLGFILLGYLLEKLTGQSLADLASARLFAPAGLTSAFFNPAPALAEECAATEVVAGQVLQGVVHDENARYLGGIAGHAGCFASGPDVARWCQLLLRAHGGDREGVLSPAAVRAMTMPQARHAGQPRGLGWDIGSDYARSLRGDLFPPGGFGHSGFTGTSVWVDPPSGIWIVLLTNRVHPTRAADVTGLRRRVANAVAAALLPARRLQRTCQPPVAVETGLEVEAAAGWPSLRGKRLGLIVNPTSIDRRRRPLADLLQKVPDVVLVRLFAPEHGLRGQLDEAFGHGRDPASGLPVISLYGASRAPEPEHLEGLDALVYDLQDVGVRFYTYTATMCLAMRAAGQAGVEFVVLDRPNLLPLSWVAGPILDDPFVSLAQYHPLPVLHGLTPGELARWAKQEYGLETQLTVIPCRRYARELWFDETGLPWVNPSPNIRTLKAAALYPALGLLERCHISVGRGTDAPFEYFGAPWMDGLWVAEQLNTLGLPGVRFVPVEFTPTQREFAGQRCSGCYVCLLDRDRFSPLLCALHIARTLQSRYADRLGLGAMAGLLGDKKAVAALENLAEPEELLRRWEGQLASYCERRAAYLLY